MRQTWKKPRAPRSVGRWETPTAVRKYAGSGAGRPCRNVRKRRQYTTTRRRRDRTLAGEEGPLLPNSLRERPLMAARMWKSLKGHQRKGGGRLEIPR